MASFLIAKEIYGIIDWENRLMERFQTQALDMRPMNWVRTYWKSEGYTEQV